MLYPRSIHLADNDFEFVKVRQKKNSIPELSSGTEFNYSVVKKLAGQGMLYVRITTYHSYVLKGTGSDSDGEFTETIPSTTANDPVANTSDDTVVENEDNSDHKSETFLGDSNIPLSLTQEIKSKPLSDPVEILRFVKGKLIHGRSLQITNMSEEIEGLTNFISVDRDNILNTTFDELRYVKDYNVTFEIDFIGEMAKDLGGPRLEWMEIIFFKGIA